MTVPLRLFELGGLWEVTTRTDPVVCALADRHYPRRSIGCGRVGGPGRTLVLRSVDHTVRADVGDPAVGRRPAPDLAHPALTADLWGAPLVWP